MNDTPSISSRYFQSILFLIVVLAVFELINGALNIVLIIEQSQASKQRSAVTRTVVVATGFCLKKPEINTKKEIENCVKETLEETKVPTEEVPVLPITPSR